MELELGLKITKTLDAPVSADFRLAKDRAGPLFISTETDSSIILTAYIKGFKKENIKISINEDGTRLIASGGKPVQEMILTGRGMLMKEAEIRGFRKVFIIPEGVVLNRIKAKLNEEESVLTISMPKKNKGIHGIGGVVEEVTEEPPSAASETAPGAASQDDAAYGSQQHEGENNSSSSRIDEGNPEAEHKRHQTETREISEMRTSTEIETVQETENEIKEVSRGKKEDEEEHEPEAEKEGSPETHVSEVSEKQRVITSKKTLNLFSPCLFMGSALFASIVVIVVSFIRSKRK